MTQDELSKVEEAQFFIYVPLKMQHCTCVLSSILYEKLTKYCLNIMKYDGLYRIYSLCMHSLQEQSGETTGFTSTIPKSHRNQNSDDQ